MELEKRDQQQSTFQSNNKAFLEKVGIMDKEAHELHLQLKQSRHDLQKKDAEIFKLSEELNLYKGRCANLQRDMDMSANMLTKLNMDSGSFEEQVHSYKNRVQQLEDQILEVQRDKNE